MHKLLSFQYHWALKSARIYPNSTQKFFCLIIQRGYKIKEHSQTFHHIFLPFLKSKNNSQLRETFSHRPVRYFFPQDSSHKAYSFVGVFRDLLYHQNIHRPHFSANQYSPIIYQSHKHLEQPITINQLSFFFFFSSPFSQNFHTKMLYLIYTQSNVPKSIFIHHYHTIFKSTSFTSLSLDVLCN